MKLREWNIPLNQTFDPYFFPPFDGIPISYNVIEDITVVVGVKDLPQKDVTIGATVTPFPFFSDIYFRCLQYIL